MKEASIIGLDLSKRSFQAHGALADGSVAFRKKLTREKVLGFLAEQPRCTVAMEGLSCQPQSPALNDYQEVLPLFHLMHGTLGVSPGRRVQMLGRLGYAAQMPPHGTVGSGSEDFKSMTRTRDHRSALGSLLDLEMVSGVRMR